MSCCQTCCDCDRLLTSTNIAVTGTAPNQVVTVTVPSLSFLRNLESFCVVFAQTIPVGTLPIVLTDGTTTMNVFNSSGNYLRADQVRTRKRYKMIWGNDPNHAQLKVKVCNTTYTV